jgi:hypothetical protein
LFSRVHWPTEAIWQREEPVDEAKPFKIPKREVWEAYKRVKANQRAAGVDGQSIAEFEADLKNNLYKLWNRLSSGSYFPPPVRGSIYRRRMVRAFGRWVLSRSALPGADPGAGVSCRLLRLPTRQICNRCRARPLTPSGAPWAFDYQ